MPRESLEIFCIRWIAPDNKWLDTDRAELPTGQPYRLGSTAMINVKLTGWTIVLAASLSIPWYLFAMATQNSAPNPWKQYRSPMGGFELRYSQDWKFFDRGKEKSWLVSFMSPAVRDRDVFLAAKVLICSNPIEDPFPKGECQERDS